MNTARRIGVISDTHGLLRDAVEKAFADCEAIVHAGDIGKPEVLDRLRKWAPVTAIRGNVDKWATELPDTAVFELAGRSFYVLHDVKELDLDPAAAGFDAVISGHSHQPRIETIGGVLFLNPGSAGPRRFRLPIAVATVTIESDSLLARIVELPA